VSDLLRQLQQALGNTYRLERELGGGGMSRVFVAEESSLGRKVVVKVLPPDLAAGLNVERFRREIQLAASLQHPHIVPLHAAGQADGLLYFTMPLVEGESLRTKLAREGEQPIGESVRILRDMVDALAYAHGRGLVHRDIKPDNILVSHHHALVTDFGVAKALSESTGRTNFTTAGVALGTPAYMAPEQAAADPHTDRRADIYAVGAVAYEMLTGRPPFTGPTAQVVLAAHVTKAPEPIGEVRPSVPPALQALVMRCLEKKPADRWQSAEEMLQQLEAMATPSGGTTPTLVVRGTRRPARLGLIAAVFAAFAAGAAAWLFHQRGSATDAVLDPRAVAVFPFRVSGADPSLAYLREGLVELLAVKLTGEGGPRAVDPSAALSAWRRRVGSSGPELDRAGALEVARTLGASKVVQGSIVGSPGRLTLTASLLAGTGEDARVSVEGPLDSLSALVDRLTAGVLTGGANVGGALAQLTTASLPALRAYLDGQSLYRRGSYHEAVRQFERALDLDSTFALAGLGLANAAGWCCSGGDRGLRVAWAGRERLGPADRAMLDGRAGPRYPEASSVVETLRAWERAVEVAPDRPDAWYGLGDVVFHWGLVLGIAEPLQRAARSFQRSLQLDSTFAGPLEHLAELAARSGDTTEASRLVGLALTADSSSEIAGFLRWRLATAKGDSAGLRSIRAEIPRMPFQSLGNIVLAAQQDALPMDDARSALAAAGRRASTRDERWFAWGSLWVTALNAGRPLEARQGFERVPDFEDDPASGIAFTILDATFGDGDTTAAASAVRELIRKESAVPGSQATARANEFANRCALEQWRLAHGETSSVGRTLEFLARSDARLDPEGTPARNFACATLLAAWHSVLSGSSDGPRKVATLDSLFRTGIPMWSFGLAHGNLVLARLYEARGDLPRAAETIKRRTFGLGVPAFLATYLRDEGRLAALTGDRAGAIRAYQHYLALRDDPELSVRPQVAEIRKELAKLLAER
jgi:serine/threonine-protein kinase